MSEEIEIFRAAISSLRRELRSIQKTGLNWLPFSAKTVFKEAPQEENDFTPVIDIPETVHPEITMPSVADNRVKKAVTKEEVSEPKKPLSVKHSPGDAKVAFIRLAPSEKEYRDTAPYTDEAAKLLDVIIEKIGWDNSQVYKDYLCPYPVDYISADSKNIPAWKHDLLERLIKQAPRYVVLFSERLSGIFFKSDKSSELLRNTPLNHHSGMTFFASWDPFYFMKITRYKKPVWEDIQKINNLLK